jgi:hypothetical protein
MQEREMQVVIFSHPGRQAEVLRRDAQQLLQRLGVSCDVKLETDEFRLARAGVMFTPAVSINGQLISNGWVPEQDEFADQLRAQLN